VNRRIRPSGLHVSHHSGPDSRSRCTGAALKYSQTPVAVVQNAAFDIWTRFSPR